MAGTSRGDIIETKRENIYKRCLDKHVDELKWLYMELYNSQDTLDRLPEGMEGFYRERTESLRVLDAVRGADPCWYRKSSMPGMMMYADHFVGSLKGVEEKLNYIGWCHMNHLHLMPLLDTPRGCPDDGYAISGSRKVREDLGTVEDLGRLVRGCHERGISPCLDFVTSHVSEDHQWVERAKAGEKEYQDRCFFSSSWTVPSMFEETVPQIFPATAPGNLTYLPETGQYATTTFYPYQWDLNYRNPIVSNEMTFNFLYLTDWGVDVLRIDAVPYIWKELGTDCRNLPRVYTIVRMMRMIGETVYPSILLLGEVAMELKKVAPYFGTVEKPECHMFCNVTTMVVIWNVATAKGVRLLRSRVEMVSALPSACTLLNYLRRYDDIGWELDYPLLEKLGMRQVPHKKSLSDFFTSRTPENFGRGVLYSDDLTAGDARFCGTTASMCGMEKAGFCHDRQAMEEVVRLDTTLHAFMLFQLDIPVLYSRDEVGQVNDYTYKEKIEKAADSRHIHRGDF